MNELHYTSIIISHGCLQTELLKYKDTLTPEDFSAASDRGSSEEESISDLNQSESKVKRFPDTMQRFARGIARINKDELNDQFDFGNPVEKSDGTGDEDAIIIYNDWKAIPTSDKGISHAVEYNDGRGIPLLDAQTATENCDGMNVIFTGNPENRAQCTAIIGNYESYHIQRWMRTDGSGPIDHNLPLALVSRGFAPRGKSNFYAPPYDGKQSQVKRHWKGLLTFLQNVDAVLHDLEPVLKKVARNNAVVVLTCNHGQSGECENCEVCIWSSPSMMHILNFLYVIANTLLV